MRLRIFVLALAMLAMHSARAGIDKVYDPLVELGEVELETRGLYASDADPWRDGAAKTKIGIGYGLTSRMFIEGYAELEKPAMGDYEVEAYELEAKFQLTEQGRYFADFGLLTELEKARQANEWEFKVGPLIQKPFGNWMGTVNLLGETKFGADAEHSGDWEFLGRARLKYLSSPRFEPGFEYYTDDETEALGPAAYGRIRLSDSEIRWEFGWLFGLDSATADNTLRWQMEWEF